MKKILITVLAMAGALFMIGCPNPASSGGNSEPKIGDRETVTVGSEILTLHYANNSTSMKFPTGQDDTGEQTLSAKFWMGETEVTYGQWKEVYDWAISNGYTFANAGRAGSQGQEGTANQILPEDAAFANHPVTMASWRDAVIWCNALSEMTGGSEDSCVYRISTADNAVLKDATANDGANPDPSYYVDSAYADVSKTGFRLPDEWEWEYSARYRGADSANAAKPGTYSNPYFTKGNFASGAITYFNDATVEGSSFAGKLANDAVAVYRYYWNGSDWVLRPEYTGGTEEVKGQTANTLGLYDMSGNVQEWCFISSGSIRISRGGDWKSTAEYLQAGSRIGNYPEDMDNDTGFRLCRTAD